jgi:hypothetical protein
MRAARYFSAVIGSPSTGGRLISTPAKLVASSTQVRGAGNPHRFEFAFGLTAQRTGSSSMSMIWIPGSSSSVRCPSGSRT